MISISESLQRVHKEIKIGETLIHFPYEPYEQQITYIKAGMKKKPLQKSKPFLVVEALNTKQNALLQSPTGTGKTLCLLTACLGWLKNYRETHRKQGTSRQFSSEPSLADGEEFPVKIIYSSRTHSQIKQVMRELSKTCYRPKTAILGSRDQFCVNNDFNIYRGSQLNSCCKKARTQDKSCKYYEELQKCTFQQNESFSNLF